MTDPVTGPLTGLTSAEATARLRDHGSNEIRRSRAEPTWHKLVAQFQDPLVYPPSTCTSQGGLIEGHDSLALARTAGFTTLVFAQLFNAFNSRSETTSAPQH